MRPSVPLPAAANCVGNVLASAALALFALLQLCTTSATGDQRRRPKEPAAWNGPQSVLAPWAAAFLALFAGFLASAVPANAQTQPSFGSCTSTMYLAIAAGGGEVQLHSVDTSDNPFAFPPIGDPVTGYNGMGYDPNTNYIYAPYWDPDDGTAGVHHLLRIGSDGTRQDMGRIIGGGINQDEARGAFATGVVGTDGFLYVKKNRGTDSEFFRINLSDRSAERIGITLNGNPIEINSGDWAWHNGLLYSHDLVNDRLYTVHPGTGVVDIIGTSNVPTAGFGSMISATNGVFGRDNNGAFYRFDTATGDATLISDAPSGAGDGAKCPTTAVELSTDLAIDKDDGSATYPPGGEVTYTIAINNLGPFGVQNATVRDPLPAGITTADWTCTATGGASCGAPSGSNANGNAIDDALVSLPAGDTVTFELTLEVPIAFSGDLTNTATVTTPSDSPDEDLNNNTDDDTDVADPVLTLEKDLVNDDGGDLWLLGEKHRLFCGDALKDESYELLMQGEKAELGLSDPPYNVKIAGNVSGLGRRKHGEFGMASGEMSESQFTDFLASAFAPMAANAVDGAIQFIFMDWRHMEEVLAAGHRSFSELKNVCVWDKKKGGMGTFYRSAHEFVFVFESGNAPHINNFGLGSFRRNRTNVWRYSGVNSFGAGRDKALGMHPTVKPVAMLADAILDCSSRRGIVLDPFGGSGSTIIAADRTGRHARLIELDPKYVDVALRRYRRVTGNDPVHADTGQTLGALEANVDFIFERAMA